MLTLTIETENAAFADGQQAAEVARILRQAASKIERGSHSGSLCDGNGNTVGRYDLERKPAPYWEGEPLP